ncbi:hypothetical protein RFI_06072 [Reticulomyxa filosa]|uniref:Uncharacterized protein n=1 Tax=Reticulomyxa filosa TaxID=46433 RepID=X6NXL4_RETFI|nr:hypothetical protein RFI_06072 [Reticulomyxa filosa]|eukprot:ETO31050.1 hypothetical protein RFI_06072 [Reticulomyxa filosa]
MLNILFNYDDNFPFKLKLNMKVGNLYNNGFHVHMDYITVKILDAPWTNHVFPVRLTPNLKDFLEPNFVDSVLEQPFLSIATSLNHYRCYLRHLLLLFLRDEYLYRKNWTGF